MCFPQNAVPLLPAKQPGMSDCLPHPLLRMRSLDTVPQLHPYESSRSSWRSCAGISGFRTRTHPFFAYGSLSQQRKDFGFILEIRLSPRKPRTKPRSHGNNVKASIPDDKRATGTPWVSTTQKSSEIQGAGTVKTPNLAAAIGTCCGTLSAFLRTVCPSCCLLLRNALLGEILSLQPRTVCMNGMWSRRNHLMLATCPNSVT